MNTGALVIPEFLYQVFFNWVFYTFSYFIVIRIIVVFLLPKWFIK